MSSHKFMLNMCLYNEFPKFWRKVCWLFPLLQPLVLLNIDRKKSQAMMEEATYWQNNSSLKHQRK